MDVLAARRTRRGQRRPWGVASLLLAFATVALLVALSAQPAGVSASAPTLRLSALPQTAPPSEGRTSILSAEPSPVAPSTSSRTASAHVSGPELKGPSKRSDNTVVATVPVGSAPEALAYDPATRDFYVSDRASGTVSVVDGATHSLVGTVPVGAAPDGVAVDTTTGAIYIVNSGSDDVSVLDAATLSVVATIPVGSMPEGIAFDVDTGALYVADAGSNAVSVLDGATNTVEATVEVGNSPTGVAYDGPGGIGYSGGGGEVYVTNSGSDTVSVISDVHNTLLSTILVGSDPVSTTFDPVDLQVYVANAGSDSISAILVGSATVAETLPLAGSPSVVSFDPGNGVIYASEPDLDSIAGFSDENNTLIGTFQVGSGPAGMGFDGATGELYVADANSAQVSVFAPHGVSWVIATIPLTQNYPEAVGYNSANGEAYFLDEAGDTLAAVASQGPATNTVIAYITVGNNPAAVAVDNLTGDGTLYVANAGSNTVSVVAGGNNTVIATIPVGSDPRGIAFDSINHDVYVNDEGSGTASVIAGLTVVATIPGVGGAGEHTTAAFDASNGDIYMCTGSGMTVINGNSNTVIGSVDDSSCYTSGYDSGNGDVYYSNAGGDIYVISGATQHIVATIGGLPSTEGIDYDYSNNYLYIGDENGGNTMTVVDGATNAVVSILQVGVLADGTTYDNVDADNYVANEQSKTASVIATVLVTSVAVSPASGTVPTNGSLNFTATPTCSGGPCPPGVTFTWSLSSGAMGTLSPPYGQYTTFTAGTTPGTVTLTMTAVLNNAPTTGSATITIIPGLGAVALSPGSVGIPVGGSQAYTATAVCTGGPCPAGTTFSWALNNSLGTISLSSGPATTFTAGPLGGLIALTVTAGLDGLWVSKTAQIGIIPVLSSVVVTPSPAVVPIGGSQNFTAVLACRGGGCSVGAVYVWSESAGLGGTLNVSAAGNTAVFTPGKVAVAGFITVNVTLIGVSHQSSPVPVQVVPGLTSVAVGPLTPVVPVTHSVTLTASPVCTGGACPAGTNFSWSTTSKLGLLTPTHGASEVFTAGTVLGNLTVYLNATLDGLTRPGNTVLVTIVPALQSVVVAPSPALVLPGGLVNFTAVSSCQGGACPTGAVYSWSTNLTLGKLNGSTGPQVRFTAGMLTGNATVNVNVTLDGIEVESTYVRIIITDTPNAPFISSITVNPSPARIGEPATVSVTVLGGVTPLAYSYTGLPPGCPSLDTSLLPCTPVSPGNYTLTVQVVDDIGRSAEATTHLEVLGPVGPMYVALFSNTTAPTEGVPFLLSATVSGGQGPFGYTWWAAGENSTTAPDSPQWSVTEPQTGTFTFQVWVTDAQGKVAGSQMINLTVVAPLIASVPTNTATPGWVLLVITLGIVMPIVAAAARSRRRRETPAAAGEALAGSEAGDLGTGPQGPEGAPSPTVEVASSAAGPTAEVATTLATPELVAELAPAIQPSGEAPGGPPISLVSDSSTEPRGSLGEPMGVCPRCLGPWSPDGTCPVCSSSTGAPSVGAPPLQPQEAPPARPPAAAAPALPLPAPPIPPPPAVVEVVHPPAQPTPPPPAPTEPLVEVTRPGPPKGFAAPPALPPAPAYVPAAPPPAPAPAGTRLCFLCGGPVEGDYCPHCQMRWTRAGE